MNELTFEILYYFLVLAEVNHYGLAAKKLYITQQALSKSIKRLEDKLGYPLFERVGRTQQLTDAGHKFRDNAQSILHELTELKTSVRGTPINHNHQIIKIAGSSLPNTPILVMIKQFLQVNQEIRFDINSELSLAQAEEQLLVGQLDFAFYCLPPTSPRLSYQPIVQSPFVVVAQPEWANDSWEEGPYVVFRPPYEVYTKLFWPEAFHHLPIVGEADLKTAILLCELGKGALYVSENYVLEHLRCKKLRLLADFPLRDYLTTYLIWNSDLSSDSLAGCFIREMQARSTLCWPSSETLRAS